MIRPGIMILVVHAAVVVGAPVTAHDEATPNILIIFPDVNWENVDA